MTKNSPSGEPNQEPQYALRSGLVREYADDRYYRQNSQLQRWLAEHKKHEAIEKALTDVSKFSYESEDYVRFLVKEPFPEPVRLEFQSMLPERLLLAERAYRHPINIRWGLMAALILSVAFFPSAITIVLVAAMLSVIGFLQYQTIRERLLLLQKIERDTRLEIENKVRIQEEQIMQQRRVHDEAEEERVDFYVRLLKGELSSVIMTIDEYLPKLPLPFPMDVDIDLHETVILVKAWLPSKMIIPQERTSLTDSGRIQYEKKESILINKQYAELCAAILMQISTVLFARVPSITKAYIWGMNREGSKEEYLLTMKMDRAQLEKVALSATALLALQGLSANYSCDEYLKLLPVEPLKPEEWQDIEPKNIRNMHVKIYQLVIPGRRNKIVENN